MTLSFGQRSALLFASTLALAGCGIGYNQTLFVTTTNLGINVDTKPPTAEISFARREIVIEPVFERGQHLPVTASFYADTSSVLPLATDIGDIFAGGAAARAVSNSGNLNADATAKPQPGVLCLSSVPTGKDCAPVLPPDGQVQPFEFGTDTVIGLKVAWSGTTAQFPDSFKLGYNRQELALAPMSGSSSVADVCPTGTKYAVSMPSFLASVHSGVAVSSPSGSQFKVGQLFATGDSATTLASNGSVKAEFLNAVQQHLAASSAVANYTYGPDDNSKTIQCWLNASDTANRRTALNNWMVKNNHPGTYTSLLYASELADARTSAVTDKDLAIKCGQ